MIRSVESAAASPMCNSVCACATRSRQFAPYIGVNWVRRVGTTANYAPQDHKPVNDRQIVAGVRLWFSGEIIMKKQLQNTRNTLDVVLGVLDIASAAFTYS